MDVSGMPAFETGGTYIVFVAGNGRVFCPLVGGLHGSYRLVRDSASGAECVTRSDTEPLLATADVGRPLDPTRFPVDPGTASGMAGAAFETAILEEAGHGSGR
jgi:hypothetical protein